MPTLKADSDCEIEEIPLTNHISNLAEGNGTKDVCSLKRKFKEENSVPELLKKRCKVEISKKEEVEDDCKIILSINTEFNDIYDRSRLDSVKFREFINTTDYVFTTPVNDVTTHPKFPKLKTTFHTIINDVFSYRKGVLSDLKKEVSSEPKKEESNEPKKEESSEPKKEESSEPKTDATNDGLEVVQVLSRSKPNLPPSGIIKRKELHPGSEVWVMKTSSVDVFVEGIVLTICDAKPEKLYKVRFGQVDVVPPKLFTAKQLAYRTNSDIIAPVGTRIVARYSDGVKPMLYAGIVAEPPKSTNLERYLIFFDDGYAQYIEHKMCIDVADDVHKNIRKFIKAYLQKYPERPMLKLQKNQVIKTEYDRENFAAENFIEDRLEDGGPIGASNHIMGLTNKNNNISCDNLARMMCSLCPNPQMSTLANYIFTLSETVLRAARTHPRNRNTVHIPSCGERYSIIQSDLNKTKCCKKKKC
ncbi:histone-lysine N-methyltransferase eggless [Trichonephila clavata]|uniref:Histone-lysine N-methyltransferase eggless n=1 Tax=Trichonephila clavata TaxID=2740835 RepID=A0A8X6KKZ4_TRICU|nr:histone-lysine N-methyltransferase eggless [Trichonephila clavata]